MLLARVLSLSTSAQPSPGPRQGREPPVWKIQKQQQQQQTLEAFSRAFALVGSTRSIMRARRLLLGLLLLGALCASLRLNSAAKSGEQINKSPKTSKSSSSAAAAATVTQSKQSKHNEASDEPVGSSKTATSSKQDNKRLAEWLREQKQAQADVIELVSSDMLELLVENLNHLVVVFYDQQQCGSGKAGQKCKKILQELENIDDDTDDHGIQFVKCEDLDYARSLGISSLPALVYFERSSSAPSIYVGDLEEEELVLEWLVRQKEEDTIENINRDILGNLIAQQQQQPSTGGSRRAGRAGQRERDYLAVLFYKHKSEQSDQAMEALESIDDDLAEFDVHLVKLADDLIAKKYGVRHPPGLVLFRHGEPLRYQGDLLDPQEMLHWLTLPENLETKNSIESVNEKMFQRFLKDSQHLAVLFHSETGSCKQCARVLDELETIDDDLVELGVRFIKVDSMALAKKYGVHALPALLFISKPDQPPGEKSPSKGSSSGANKLEPTVTIYAGDLKRGEEILRWISEQKSPHLNEIPELSGRQCKELIKSREHVAVFVYSKDDSVSKGADRGDEDHDDDNDPEAGAEDDDDDEEEEEEEEDVLAGLENIDTECRKHMIEFVKTDDRHFAAEFGLTDDADDLPALIYFEQGQPSIYDGDLRAEEDLLDWLLKQKREDTIEEVNRKLLERLIESSHYLVVLFQKANCKSCQTVLETLERIDDDCDAYGINMVKITDMALAKRYGIKTFPALVYFRNGNPLIYSGDLKDDQEVLEWLLEDEQRELNDEIEDINGRMLDKLIDSSPFLAVLFYDDDCGSICNKVLHELEKIDDDTDLFGIDFVKINDFQAARRHSVHSFPTLVYFRKQTPSYFDGDLLDEEAVLNWLTSSDVFELEDEIEEVNKKMLDKLIETSDYIAVYFYEKNCKRCEEVLKELEHIDDEADSLDIMFVKIRDMNYAKKFGITQAPSLVYFRKKFPSIYRGDLMREEKVLEWLRKNRYRNPELNLFMYALFTITISFILYTIFLMFCVKKKQD